MEIKLRPYQQQCKEVVKKKLDQGVTRQLIVAATGTGKRLMAVEESMNWERTLFLCHREELIEQAYEDFSKVYPLQVGIIKGPVFQADKRIVIGSAQTMWRRLDKMNPDMFDVVMADEVHHYLAPTYIRPLNHFNSKLMLGYTATPTRLDGLNFSNIVDEITFEYPIDKAVQEGYLCKIDAIRVKTDLDISDVKRVGGDFNQKDLSDKVDNPVRNALIVNKFRKHAPKRKGITFCVDIKHAIRMAEIFQEYGINAQPVHSQLDKDTRRRRIAAFRSGSVQVLTNVNILTEGFDESDVGVVMMARPTQSLSLYMQMIGRGTRLKSQEYIEQNGKDEVLVLDFVDNTGNHKLINTWELDKKKKPEDRVFLSEEKREKLIQHRLGLEQERIAKIKRYYKTDKVIDLLALPDLTVQHRGRMLEPATEKQIAWLKSEGVWQEGVEYTKGQASEHITNFPAKEWMLHKLAEWGYDVLQGATMGQYYDIKREREEDKNPRQPFAFSR